MEGEKKEFIKCYLLNHYFCHEALRSPIVIKKLVSLKKIRTT